MHFKIFSTVMAAAFSLLMLPLNASAVMHETKRPDKSTIYWSLDMPEKSSGKADLIVLMQGSGCEPTTRNKNMQMIRSAFGDFASLTVEKYGIHPNYQAETEEGYFQDCPPEYHQNSTHDQRVADYLQVFKELADAKWWSGRLVLLGGSEGGDIAVRVASRISTSGVILISTGGGMTFGEQVKASILMDMEQKNVPEAQRPDIDALFKDVRENKNSDKMLFGYSYKYWANSIDYKALDDMLKINAPILLLHGSADTSAPAQSARQAVEAFQQKNRCNLTYWELSGHDHGMNDPQGQNHMNSVLSQASVWINTQLAADNVSSYVTNSQ